MYMEYINELNNLDEDMLFEMANMTPQELGYRIRSGLIVANGS